jgi:hypothetical protein
VKRTSKKVSLGGDSFKSVVQFESEPCSKDTLASRKEQVSILKTLVDTPSLLVLGYREFEKLTMTHNGNAWVVTLEVTE